MKKKKNRVRNYVFKGAKKIKRRKVKLEKLFLSLQVHQSRKLYFRFIQNGLYRVYKRPQVIENRKNDLILIMTPEKQDKTLELSKPWSVDSTPAGNEVIMKRTYPVKLVKCDKICSNY